MGTRGPVGKRDAERRRRNAPAVPTQTVDIAKLVKEPIEIPEPGEWHPAAIEWYESLASSGQSVFYEPSDWSMAYMLGEVISRELSPQPVVLTDSDGSTRVEMHEQPMKGASLTAILKGFTALMVAEGDRRRLNIELERQRGELAVAQAGATVLSIVQDREAALS